MSKGKSFTLIVSRVWVHTSELLKTRSLFEKIEFRKIIRFWTPFPTTIAGCEGGPEYVFLSKVHRSKVTDNSPPLLLVEALK